MMAFGDVDACEGCIFGVNGPTQTCDECELGDCFVPAEEDRICDKKFNRYQLLEVA